MLDDVAFVFQRIEVGAKGEAAGDVDRKALKVARHVNRRAVASSLLPAPLQPRGNLVQSNEELAQVVGVQGLHDQLPLAAPVGAFRAKDAVDSEIEHRITHDSDPGVPTGTILEDLVDQRRRRDRNSVRSPQSLK